MTGAKQTLSGGGNGASADRSEDVRLETLEDFARHVRRMAREEAAVRALLADGGGSAGAGDASTRPMAPNAKAQNGAYEQLIARIRETAAASIPAGATVAVVSKGDPKLLELAAGRRGWRGVRKPKP